MTFGEKLKQLRKEKKYSQIELANLLGITSRTLQNYESGKMYPKQGEVYIKIASVFNISTDYLLNSEEKYLMEASQKGGPRARQDVSKMLSEVATMFSGGELSENDKDKFMRAVTDLYWLAKEKNKKYAPNKVFEGDDI